MKSELDAKTIASLRAELQDLLESAYAAGSDDNESDLVKMFYHGKAYAAGSDDGESDLVKMFYHGKADAYESSLSLINVALGGDPDEEEES